jgi:hypothetical protein
MEATLTPVAATHAWNSPTPTRTAAKGYNGPTPEDSLSVELLPGTSSPSNHCHRALTSHQHPTWSPGTRRQLDGNMLGESETETEGRDWKRILATLTEHN